MEKQHFSVARVVTHTKENISKFERHDERKNATYSNTNIVAEKTPMNIYFKSLCPEENLNFEKQINDKAYKVNTYFNDNSEYTILQILFEILKK